MRATRPARGATGTGSGAGETPSPFEQHRSYWYPHRLDYEALADSADLLIGEHDFRAFTPTVT